MSDIEPTMPNLYIKVIDGKTMDHPVVEDNLMMIYGEFTPDNPPENYEKFIRHPVPEIKGYFKKIDRVYKRNEDGIFEDTFVVYDMDEDEKQNLIDQLKQSFPHKKWVLSFTEEGPRFDPPCPPPDLVKTYLWTDEDGWQLSEHQLKGWRYHEDINTYKAPVDYPKDGRIYAWCNDTLQWVLDEDDENCDKYSRGGRDYPV